MQIMSESISITFQAVLFYVLFQSAWGRYFSPVVIMDHSETDAIQRVLRTTIYLDIENMNMIPISSQQILTAWQDTMKGYYSIKFKGWIDLKNYKHFISEYKKDNMANIITYKVVYDQHYRAWNLRTFSGKYAEGIMKESMIQYFTNHIVNNKQMKGRLSVSMKNSLQVEDMGVLEGNPCDYDICKHGICHHITRYEVKCSSLCTLYPCTFREDCHQAGINQTYICGLPMPALVRELDLKDNDEGDRKDGLIINGRSGMGDDAWAGIKGRSVNSQQAVVADHDKTASRETQTSSISIYLALVGGFLLTISLALVMFQIGQFIARQVERERRRVQKESSSDGEITDQLTKNLAIIESRVRSEADMLQSRSSFDSSGSRRAHRTRSQHLRRAREGELLRLELEHREEQKRQAAEVKRLAREKSKAKQEEEREIREVDSMAEDSAVASQSGALFPRDDRSAAADRLSRLVLRRETSIYFGDDEMSRRERAGSSTTSTRVLRKRRRDMR